VSPRDDIDKWIAAACDDGWDPFKDGWEPSESEINNESPGLPLTAADLPTAHRELSEWVIPREFRRRVQGFHKRSRSKEIFNDPKRKFLLDAWVLAELSKHEQFDQIRLADVGEQWPDGYAQTQAGEQKIEVTCALFPGRHLGAEYRFEGPMQYDPVENWIERAESIPVALEKAVRAKVEKRYASPFALAVYLNISEYGIRQAETEWAIANIKSSYGASFQRLWILWKDKVF
jgi:hypothetical protein